MEVDSVCDIYVIMGDRSLCVKCVGWHCDGFQCLGNMFIIIFCAVYNYYMFNMIKNVKCFSDACF